MRPAPTLRQRLARLSPFGLGHTKPKHFRDMLRVIWENRDNLPYAWKVLSRGVCDGCALGVAGFKDWTIKGPHLCMTRLNLLRLNTMPAMADDALADVDRLRDHDNRQLRHLGRLAYPQRRRRHEAGFTRISWDEALTTIGQRIQATTPDRLAFFVTARGVTNEVYYLAQKAARWLGTNSIDNAARLCHSPSTAAMKQTLGISASTCSYSDWFEADVVVFFGSNPANDQPVSTKYLQLARQRGTRIVIVNPYLEPGMQRYWVPSNLSSALFGTDLIDEWYAVAQGGDIAFIYGVIKHLEAAGLTDPTFLRDHTSGWPELAARARDLDWVGLERAAGLPAGRMMAFAEMIGAARKGVLVWSMGVTQHSRGADAVRMILHVALARGWLGRDGCGVMPIRGHSSVQGGAEMGAYSTALPGGVPITPDNAQALSQAYQFEVPPRPGLNTTEMVEACHRGDLDVFHMVGGNFLRTLPDPRFVAESLQRVPLRIHQDIIVTDQMLIDPADEVILLPAKTRYEQDDGGIETSTERRVMFTPEIPRAVGEARAEWKILRDIALAGRTDDTHVFGCSDGQAIREEIARVVSFYDGAQNLHQTGDAFQYGGDHLCAGGVCPTPDGRAQFTAVELPEEVNRPPGVFHVSTRRGKQFNTLIYADIDPLNDAPRDAVLMNADDAAEKRLSHGDRVTLRNDRGTYSAAVHLAPIARGNLQIHWPEGNHLLDRRRRDAGGGVPDYNALVEVVTTQEE